MAAGEAEKGRRLPAATMWLPLDAKSHRAALVRIGSQITGNGQREPSLLNAAGKLGRAAQGQARPSATARPRADRLLTS